MAVDALSFWGGQQGVLVAGGEPVEGVGRVAGVPPQLQSLPAIRVQVLAMPVAVQQISLPLA